MAEREIEKALREGGRGEERGERVAMHNRERNIENLQGWGEGRREGRKSTNAWQREKQRKPTGRGVEEGRV